MTKTKDDGRQIRPFAAVIQDIARGQLTDRLSEGLADLAAVVRQTQKPGTLTLTLKVEPLKETTDDAVLTVTANCVVKLPTQQQASVLFADDAGNLTRTDPRQQELPLRDVSKGASA